MALRWAAARSADAREIVPRTLAAVEMIGP
jgi:hypothetical protein